MLHTQFEGALYSLAFTQPAWSIQGRGLFKGRGLFEGRELFEEIRYAKLNHPFDSSVILFTQLYFIIF